MPDFDSTRCARFAVQLTVMILLALRVTTASEPNTAAELSVASGQVSLVGPDAASQLVISQTDPSGRSRDVTREVEFVLEPTGIATVDETGYVTPRADGQATITASIKDSGSVTINVAVSEHATHPTISFPNDIVPHLTRAGCNGGSCHGTPKGQNNFRLSLLGFEPKSDYAFLTQESRGRRIFPAAPTRSLILEKASGDRSHRGGIRLPKDSTAYNLMQRWISGGLAYGPENDPAVDHIEIFPAGRVVQRLDSQQLAITAYFSDGTSRDITRSAEYKANQPDMCAVDHHGLVSIKEVTGTTAVMVRFQEHVAAFTATIPMGVPTPNLPEPTSFVDEHTFAKFQTLGLPPSTLR